MASIGPRTAARGRVRFACTDCGNDTPKWQGQCPACGAWNTLVEMVERPGRSTGRGSGARSSIAPAAVSQPLDTVSEADARRRPTGIGEVDRVLGGGVVPGSLILLGGDPGIGKSTLALQLAARAGTAEAPALYCAGEESAAQVAMRARRLGVVGPTTRVLAETDLDALVAALDRERPALAVIDSIQTVYSADAPGAPGSPVQVREAVARLLAAAKASNVPTVLIGHVTKEGAIAGPRTLEHMVDVVLYLEGERHGDNRVLRGIKNRFGATGEVGLFAMSDDGVRELPAAGRAFLDEVSLGVPGAALTVACEGTRPLAVEVQALAATSAFGLPRRTASGFDLGRLHLLLAVLEKRGQIPFDKRDVYVNAVGGIRLAEPAHDLAVALAVASSASDVAVPSGCVVLGEVGLGGEIRRVRRLETRLAEALTVGMEDALVPAGHDLRRLPAGLRYHRVATLREALDRLR